MPTKKMFWQAKSAPKPVKKEDLFTETQSKIGELFAMLKAQSIEQTQSKLFTLVKHFFTTLIHQRAQATYEEILNELDKKPMPEYLKTQMKVFLSRMPEVEYSKSAQSIEQMQEVLRDFAECVLAAKSQSQNTDPEITLNFATKSGIPEIGRAVKEFLNPSGSSLEKITALIRETENALTEQNITKCRAMYERISDLFDNLSADEKKSIYPTLMELYQKIVQLH